MIGNLPFTVFRQARLEIALGGCLSTALLSGFVYIFTKTESDGTASETTFDISEAMAQVSYAKISPLILTATDISILAVSSRTCSVLRTCNGWRDVGQQQEASASRQGTDPAGE